MAGLENIGIQYDIKLYIDIMQFNAKIDVIDAEKSC